MKQNLDMLKSMHTLFVALDKKSWYQGEGRNPAKDSLCKNNRKITDKQLKNMLNTPCCLGAKMVAYLDVKHPGYLNGESKAHHFTKALTGLAKMFNTTEFHMHRALVEAGATESPFDEEAYTTPQPEVIGNLLKLEKVPDLKGFHFNHVMLGCAEGSKFEGLNFTGSTLQDFCHQLELDRCKFDKCEFQHFDIDSSTLTNCSFKKTDHVCTSGLRCVFINVDFSGSGFRSCDFSKAQFKNCNFDNTNFGSHNFFNKAVFEGCSFMGSNLGDSANVVKMAETEWTGCTMPKDLAARIKKRTDTTLSKATVK